MNTVKKGNLVFSRWDDLYIHPEKFFQKRYLSIMKPYRIFTGVGFALAVDDAYLNKEYYFFKDKKELEYALRSQFPDEQVTIEECFFAKIVRQETSDTSPLFMDKTNESA